MDCLKRFGLGLNGEEEIGVELTSPKEKHSGVAITVDSLKRKKRWGDIKHAEN